MLAKKEKTQQGWKIIESVPPAQGSIVLSTVTVDTIHRKINVEKGAPFARPVYYYLSEDRKNFLCSSHICLLKDFGVKITENVDALPEFFIYGYVMPPITLYANIKRLSFWQSLNVDINGKKCLVNEEPGFSLVHSREKTPLTKIIDTILMDLRSTIEPFKAAKENLAVLLSGGLDSSILSKIVKDETGAKQTFSTGYPFEDWRGNSERKYAISASSALETEHVYYEATTFEFIKGVIEATEIAEEPIQLQAVLLHLLLSSGLSKNRKLIVCGLGADTLFGGETSILVENSRKSLLHLFAINPMVRLISGQMSKIPPFSRRWQDLPKLLEKIVKARNDYSLNIKDPSHILWSSYAHGNKEWVANKFQGKLERSNLNRVNLIRKIRKLIDRNLGLSLHDLIFLTDLTEIQGVAYSIWSKIAERAGKILVCPFMDSKLVSDAYSISWELKLRKPKFILRKVARAIGIPKFIITRRKLGMEIDPKIWAVKGGVLEPLVPVCHEVFDEIELRSMQSPEPEQSATFWYMLSYAIWKQICIEDKSVSSLLSKLNMPAKS